MTCELGSDNCLQHEILILPIVFVTAGVILVWPINTGVDLGTVAAWDVLCRSEWGLIVLASALSSAAAAVGAGMLRAPDRGLCFPCSCGHLPEGLLVVHGRCPANL